MAAVAPIDPAGLAAHARRLAAGPSDATSLRRATSAAYYAVFHAITLGVAAHLTPGSRDEVRYRLARSVDHGRLTDVCAWLTGAASARREVRPVVARLRGTAALVELATHVLRLQAARHGADYDHLTRVDHALAGEHHDTAVRALELLGRLEGTVELGEFYALVALHTTLR